MHENGKSRFLPKFLCLKIPKKFVVTTSKFQNIWDLENFLSYHDFPSKFQSQSTEKLREKPSSVSESFKREVSKKIMNKNGMSRLSVESFLSEGAKKFRWGTLRYTRKVRLSKNFMPKRLISLFSHELYSPMLPIKFVRETLFVSESMGHRRFLCSVGGVAIFRWFFWPASTENFRR